MLNFTKTVRTTYYPLWIKRDYSFYTEKWRAVRDKMSYKANSCFKCSKKFVDNEAISLICLENVGNKVFCQNCADFLNK